MDHSLCSCTDRGRFLRERCNSSLPQYLWRCYFGYSVMLLESRELYQARLVDDAVARDPVPSMCLSTPVKTPSQPPRCARARPSVHRCAVFAVVLPNLLSPRRALSPDHCSSAPALRLRRGRRSPLRTLIVTALSVCSSVQHTLPLRDV